MKKILFPVLVFLTIFGSFLVSCEKDDVSGRHEYTPEELAEIKRQDSLKQIIPADYVFTKDVTLPYSENWVGVTVKLVEGKDTTKLLELLNYNSTPELVTALGTLEGTAPDLIQAGNDITFYAYNWSTKYEVNDPSSTNNLGHWFDGNGDVTTWGNGQKLYCEKIEGSTLEFMIGHLPGADGPKVGDVFHIVEAMKYDTTSVAFVLNVTIAAEAPLVYPKTTIAGTSTYDIEVEQDNNYTATAVTIDAAAINAAIGIAPGDAEIYGIDDSDDSLYIKGSTAEAPGYWFNSNGDVCKWGDTLCVLFANYIIADQKFNVGQFPDGPAVGQTYTVKVAFVNLDNLKQYNVVINVKIKAAAAVYPETTLEKTIDLALSVDSAGKDVWVDNLLALDSAAIESAIGCVPSAATIYGVNESTDSLVITGLTGNNGCWFNASGDVCKWGAPGISMYVEYRTATHQIGFGQHPESCKSGTTYYGRLAFVNGTKRAEVKVAMTIK